MTNWTDDEALMAALGEAVAESDEVTDRRRTSAQDAFGWRTVDAELMELLHDSALDAGAAVRSSSDTARLLAFARDGLLIELEVGTDVVLGQVIPGQAATVTVQRTGTDDVTVTTDTAGFFRVETIGAGSTRFRITTDSVTLVTAWVTL